jgi:phospholipase C
MTPGPASQIASIVILMKENHSFDNYFGMLGRGDGFTLDAAGVPTNANPDRSGKEVTSPPNQRSCIPRKLPRPSIWPFTGHR